MASQIRFRNDLNSIAIILNTIWLMSAVVSFVDQILSGLIGKCLLLLVLTYLLLANFIRLTKKTIKIKLDDGKLVFKSMFGWNRSIPVNNPTRELFVVRDEPFYPSGKMHGDLFNYFLDGIRALFNLKRRRNLFYNGQLIYKGVVGNLLTLDVEPRESLM